jgi:ACS family D-galactonate transporter-like MFS transporter
VKEKWNWRQMWILILIFTGTMINAIDRSSMGAANSFIANDLHLDKATMGIILSVFGWTYLLFNLPAGWLSDRFGTKKVYGIAAAIWSIASALTGLAKTAAHLIVSRAFVGLGEAANFPAATKVVAENYSPSSRSTATGIYLAGLRLGYALTPGIMIGLMVWFGSQAHPDWRMAFIITGLGSFLWVILWFATFRESGKPNYLKSGIHGPLCASSFSRITSIIST